ncbi:MAG: PQQ-binding-like beta-propeller repeat protein, partial [candidate division Zixibacteria bacterium]|nr:PQQ-binding-like beta-propeller repeat protein [candidate division Zixibacteria bacterium]
IDLDGNILWWYPLGWCVFSSPALRDDGLAVFGSKDHNITVFRDSIPFGSIVWQHPLGTFYDGHLIDCSPAIGDDGTVYIGTDGYGAAGMGQEPFEADTNFFAITADGNRKWSYPMGGCESSPAIGFDGTIYMGSYDSCVYALVDMGTHAVEKWKYKTGGKVDASPTVDADGTIYIGSRDGNLYALRPEDGSVKWSYPTGGGIASSVTIGGDGYIYVGSDDGKLYALGNGSPDMGAISVDVIPEVEVNSSVSPTATVRNYRMTNQALEAVFIIEEDGSPVYTDTVSVPNAPGSTTKSITFGPWTVGPDSGTAYTATVFTLLAADENLPNDTAFGAFESTTALPYICGDISGDGAGPDISDLVYLVDFMFTGGPPPPIFNAADIDASGALDISDLVYLVDFMFTGGPPPVCN